MDIARRLVQLPTEKIVYSAAARVSALVAEVKKDFEQDPVSSTLVDNLEKMARDEQICTAFIQSDAFQSSMLLWEREFETPRSSTSSVAVIENQSNNNSNNNSNQALFTTGPHFTFPTFSDSSSSYNSSDSSSQTSTFTASESTFSTSFDPELRTFHAPRWATSRTQRTPISDRIANYVASFWKLFFRHHSATKPVVVGQSETIPKSVSTEDIGVPGSPPPEYPGMTIAVAGVAILLLASFLRFDYSVFHMTATQGKEAAQHLVQAFISKVRLLFK